MSAAIGEPSAASRAVRSALPAVARFEAAIEQASPEEHASLVGVADRVAAHRFDLLGSGPTDLGGEIDWLRDFKSGRRWPLDHISRIHITYPDDSDIKVPWELSRFQHLPVLAAAARLTGDGRYTDEIGAQLESWISANPVEFGPNWACTMDVAIRASNWTAALALCGQPEAGAPWLPRVLESLLLHGRFVRGHLEWAEVRGNHYLSNVVGLQALAALFSAGEEGRRWARWAAAELVSEMEHQVRPDGCDHEASIPYHRLVTELMVCGTAAAEALAPGSVPQAHRERLGRMLEFVRDYTRPDGTAPQVGDADDGRFLPLGDYGRADPRTHLHLFEQAGVDYQPARGHASYPDGGYWVMRAGGLYVLVRCGDVGVGGLGSHAHNDQLSFELSAGTQPMVVDPGSYLYTADPDARNQFRSTSFHSTLRIGEAEQNEIGSSLFALEELTCAEALDWSTSESGASFTGRHHGYERLDPPATHDRRIQLDGSAGELVVTDTVSGEGEHLLEWTLPLAPCDARGGIGEATAAFDGGELRVEADGLEFVVEEGWYSPRYGERVRTPFLRARRRAVPGEDVTRIRLRAGMGPEMR